MANERYHGEPVDGIINWFVPFRDRLALGSLEHNPYYKVSMPGVLVWINREIELVIIERLQRSSWKRENRHNEEKMVGTHAEHMTHTRKTDSNFIRL